MASITFYRQARRDGGIRSGIEVDNDTVLSRFEHGQEPSDPALLWYIDVTCTGSRLPQQPEPARQWLLRHEQEIARFLRMTADRVPSGLDPGDWPLRKTFRLGQANRVLVACSAARRLEAQQISDRLRDLADNWRDRIEQLDALQPT